MIIGYHFNIVDQGVVAAGDYATRKAVLRVCFHNLSYDKGDVFPCQKQLYK